MAAMKMNDLNPLKPEEYQSSATEFHYEIYVIIFSSNEKKSPAAGLPGFCNHQLGIKLCDSSQLFAG